MSFQQGLVVIVISIKCLYIYFLRNSTNFPRPRSFEKFQVIGKKTISIAVERVMGLIEKDSCFRKNYLFRKKTTFFQPQTMASPPPQLRWGHWRRRSEIFFAKNDEIGNFSKLPAQHNTWLLCRHNIHSSLSLQKDKLRNHYIIKSPPSSSAFIKSNCVIYILS